MYTDADFCNYIQQAAGEQLLSAKAFAYCFIAADEEERQKSITDWHKTILRLAREQGEDMVKQAGPVAFAGRSVSQTIGKGKNEKTVTVHYSAPEAFNRFLYAIHKAVEE